MRGKAVNILNYYLESQKNISWVLKFQSTSGAQAGKTFSYINTNFRAITAFFNQLQMFEAKDGLRRSEWHDYQENGQEKDKHRVINLINAGFLEQEEDVYRITNKGKTLLSLYKNSSLTDAEKWPLVLLLLLDYKNASQELDIIYSAMTIYSLLEKHGVTALRLLGELKSGVRFFEKEKMFRSSVFWLITFAKDPQFIQLFESATDAEREELYEWVIEQSKNKSSADCIAHKFVSGGAYTTATFNDDLKVLLSILILLMLQDKNAKNYLELFTKIFVNTNYAKILTFYQDNIDVYSSVYENSIQVINKKIGVKEMEIDKRLEDVKIALGFASPTEKEFGEIDYAWYVGATGENDDGVYTDFSEQYIIENRWENRYDLKYTEMVKTMKEGDRIVIKSSYTKKNDLPFDNHGKTVGVMGIKAIGIITKNYMDGKNIDVKWERVTPIKEWFGDGVLRTTVHCVRAADSYIKKALLMFTFENMPQDYSVFDESDDETTAAVGDVEKGENKKTLPKREPRKEKLMPINCILYGAPGTGKTYSTVEYAVALLDKQVPSLGQKSVEERKSLMERYKSFITSGRIVFTTFHQSYGYEDFIQGLRPINVDGNVSFVTVDGVFKKIAERAIVDQENDYIIIIDEINRANISKVFGELITLIEEDKRWGEANALSVTLPSGEEFAVPNNLYILGTMNSADKSISLIDTALRRRFEFVEVVPNAELIEDVTLRTVLTRLNDNLVKELDSTDLLIGHAYFMGKTANDLCNIMNNNIIPLLYEYFYDNSKKVEKQVKEAVEGFDVDLKNASVGRIKLVKKV